MSGQRIPYPKIAGSLVDSINAVVSGGELPDPGKGAAWSVAPTIVPAGYDACLSLSFTVGGSSVRAHLNRAAVDWALGDLIDFSAFATLDDDLKLAVLEVALTGPLGALSELLDAEVALENVARGPMDAGAAAGRLDEDPESPSGILHFEVRHPPDVVRCTVLVDLVTPLPGSAAKALAESPAGPACDLGGVPVPVTFELGTASVSTAEFRSLEPGDIVLFDQCHVVEGRLRVNICDTIRFAGELDGHRLTVQGRF